VQNDISPISVKPGTFPLRIRRVAIQREFFELAGDAG